MIGKLLNTVAVGTIALSIMLTASVIPAAAQSKKGGGGLPLIRDAEIEGLLRLYSKGVFKAAGLNGNAVKVYVIADRRINAFVTGGQRIFIHTGLFTRSKTPDEVIGVLAHETGHIAGGHLARLKSEVESASVQSIIGMLAGVAVMAGGVASGSSEAAKVGQGVMLGSQSLAQRNFLTYQRSMEASADQAALKYLNATGQSAKGMLDLFQLLANESLASAENVDPYLQSHPMPLERIRNLERVAKQSPNFNKPPDKGLQLRHDLVKAKLAGFMETPQAVFQRYPKSNTSLPARYARAIAMFRRGDLANAIPIIDNLTDELPQNPYFWELKAQAYNEAGRFEQALPAIRQARKLLPNNGLLQLMEAESLLGNGNAKNAEPALKLLRLARRTEPDSPIVYKLQAQAYGLKGDIPRAELATAEFAYLRGDKELAIEKSRRATQLLKKGTPEWLRASDLYASVTRKK
jgi:predicted Zn-dependent protease